MEIRNLVTFVRIAEVKNFSKTAQQLGYSQSAVTMQIKQLEEELQTSLFERIGKQVKLTQAGQRLLPYALEILNSLQNMQMIVHEPEEIRGPLRIGTCESYLISVLPPIFSKMRRICPQAEISTHTAMVEDLFHMMRQNDVDVLYFLDEKLYFPEWIKVSEEPERIHFVASAASPLAAQKKIPVERILQEPLYLTERGISYRYAMEQALAAVGFAVKPFLEIGNTDVITSFIRQGFGISFLPEYVVKDDIADGRLAILDVDLPPITMWSQLVYHRSKLVTPQMQIFLNLMQERTSLE